MKLISKYLLIFLLFIFFNGCNQPLKKTAKSVKIQIKEVEISNTENCINLSVIQKDNPLKFKLLEGISEFNDSIVNYRNKKNVLRLVYNSKKLKYDLFINSRIILDSSWVKSSSVFTIDIHNLKCYHFLWKDKYYYILINSNSQATGLATNYYQIFIYDVKGDNFSNFSSMSGSPLALRINKNKLEFVRISFADEYFHNESSGKTPLKVEILKFDNNNWTVIKVNKIYCED